MTLRIFPARTELFGPYALADMLPEHLDDAARIMAFSEPWQSYGYQAGPIRDFIEGSMNAGIARAVVRIPAQAQDEAAGECVGVVFVQPAFLGGRFLEILAIDEAHRGQGLGGRIVEAVCREMPENLRDLFSLTAESNVKAREFYRRLGFKDVGPLQGLVLPDKVERLIWLRFR